MLIPKEEWLVFMSRKLQEILSPTFWVISLWTLAKLQNCSYSKARISKSTKSCYFCINTMTWDMPPLHNVKNSAPFVDNLQRRNFLKSTTVWNGQNFKKIQMAAKIRKLRGRRHWLFCSWGHYAHFKKNCSSLAPFWKIFPC